MVGRRRCRRYRRCGRRMLPICEAVLHAVAASRLCCAVGLLSRNMILLRDLGIPICGNARCLLQRLGITPADRRSLRSCRTGCWRILRTARLLRSCAISCGIMGRYRMRIRLFSWRAVLCGSWRCAAVRHRRISCHTGSRRGGRSWTFRRRLLHACHVRSLHKGTALLNRFRLRIL